MHNGVDMRVALWGRFEQVFTGAGSYANPAQDVALTATFRAPSGAELQVDGFWDGGTTWRVRFMPSEPGMWSFTTQCSAAEDAGLHARLGAFVCGDADGANRFAQHGPVHAQPGSRYLAHADGTPFLWLADTAWNGALRSTPEEWEHYLQARTAQGFTAAHVVVTQWIAAPNGDIDGHLAYTGSERIAINPAFFQRLDARLDAMNRAGMLAVPVMLWAATWTEPGIWNINPGVSLPEDQAILLARYMVARWGAHHLAWILNGDGDYRGERAARWQRIGRAVFGDRPHAPVMLHPSGMNIPADEFRNERWLDITSYQSGHGDDNPTLRWIWDGPPAQEWRRDPPRPLINLEPPYEDHIAYQSRERLSAHKVRRAMYWSLLIAPPAGVSYGGHGVWGWDDGTTTPEAHPATGVPKPWREALHLPAAEQIAHLAALFGALDWWRLWPAPELLATQPGDADDAAFVGATRAPEGDLALLYTPVAQPLALDTRSLRSDMPARWFDPRNGTFSPASGDGPAERVVFAPPAEGDWLLVLG